MIRNLQRMNENKYEKSFLDEVNSLFNDIYGMNYLPYKRRFLSPKTGNDAKSDLNDCPMNVISIKNDGIVTAKRLDYSLPGFTKDEINVTLDNNVLSIDAEKNEKTENVNEDVEYRGFTHKKIKMSHEIPETLDVTSITSKFVNGILSITIPVKKIEKKDNSIKIEIN